MQNLIDQVGRLNKQQAELLFGWLLSAENDCALARILQRQLSIARISDDWLQYMFEDARAEHRPNKADC